MSKASVHVILWKLVELNVGDFTIDYQLQLLV